MGAHQSGSIWAKTFRSWMHKYYPQYVEAGNERCVYVMRESEELAPINLDELRGLKIEKNAKIIIVIMNTDDMLIAYSDNARDLVDFFEKKLNNFFEATPLSQIEHCMGMYVLYDQDKGILTLDPRRHVYGFINHMGLDADSDVGVSTPLDPNEVYSKMDSPPEIDVKLRDKAWRAHGKLIHLAIWARPISFILYQCSEIMCIIQARNYGTPIQGSLSTWLRLETSSSFTEQQTSNLWISSPMATLTPTGPDVFMIENLQASISSFCSAQQSAGK